MKELTEGIWEGLKKEEGATELFTGTGMRVVAEVELEEVPAVVYLSGG